MNLKTCFFLISKIQNENGPIKKTVTRHSLAHSAPTALVRLTEGHSQHAQFAILKLWHQCGLIWYMWIDFLVYFIILPHLLAIRATPNLLRILFHRSFGI